MTDTMIRAGLAQQASPGSTTVGPIVAAVGGVDPESVLRATRALAPISAAGVVAASVVASPSAPGQGVDARLTPSGDEDEDEDEDEGIAEAMSELQRQLAALGTAAAAWTKRVIHGSPAIALTNLAREQHAPMLIVGIGRHLPIDRLFGAETALRTIQRAPCPVLVVHPSFEGVFQNVVIATDFSSASLAAAEAAMPMIGPAAVLHVVHVWEPSESADAVDVTADDAYARSLPGSFRRFVELLPIPPGATVTTHTREGRPAERVLEYAQTHHADLVTAGRRGRSLLQRLLVGNQTAALVRATDRSLLIAPEPPLAERDRIQLMLSGFSESTEPARWDAQLRALSRRNDECPTAIEVDDRLSGTQVVESGYLLLGATYDASARRIELTLGDSTQRARRVTRVIDAVDSILIETDSTGRDIGVRISHGGGQTALTFLGE